MNLHAHPGFYLYGILERAGRYGDRLLPHHRGITLGIGLFIGAVPIQICAEVQILAVELRKG